MANISYTLEKSQTILYDQHPQYTTMTPSIPPPVNQYHQSITTTTPASTKMPLPFTKSIISPTITTAPSALSSSYSSTHSYLSTSSFSTSTSTSSSSSASSASSSYFTWLVFLEERWTPFDTDNQKKLEQTLSLGGTFVDITDTNFPHVKRVRVFPKTNYLSYLGVKYRLSRIMQPDAWLDHT